ncbi:MAG: hypothetical protein F4Z59_06165, partial [Gemmatimonadales bacterium]|nr:hypothetical protein [Gemmatimonadales bacterium]
MSRRRRRGVGAARRRLAGLAAVAAAACGDAAPADRSAAGDDARATGRPVSALTRNQALHIPMRDGVRIAVDVWLPEGIRPGDRLPAMMRATRYWRARGEVGVPV